MKKFDTIIDKYLKIGVSKDDIEYAISEVKNGTKRAYIIENLTDDYRSMHFEQATELLEDLFAANGGEFKKENRGGYLYGIVFLMFGLSCTSYILYTFICKVILIRPILVFLGAITCNFTGILYLVKSIKGSYRDCDEPFTD